MKLKDLFKRTKKEERPEKIDKTKTAVAEMLLDDELMKMVAGGRIPSNVHLLYNVGASGIYPASKGE